VNTPCKLCEKKRARRYCPGVQGDICPVCCGTGRETTIDCPSQCEHLQEARAHERLAPLSKGDVPNQDIRVTEQFLQQNEALVAWLGLALAGAMDSNKAVDRDAGEALASLIQTYRTLQSGLIYETRPQNPYAAAIQQALKESVDDLTKRLNEESGMHTLRDSDVLGALVFMQRLQIQHDNGRPRGRAFYDFMRELFPAQAQSELRI
jgi:hypothetical protein